ncbi:11962_t:CDS:2 [Diversispora eburnea]|uniref:11962_t:CDS:1 n=1 Tax=Diversispora eburnea TaxID=1213867 RepID=A0A9N8VK07_9GLOM|nr:11962_t:CDS:2 [Diversispora eburnea]
MILISSSSFVGFVVIDGDNYCASLSDGYDYNNDIKLTEKPYECWSHKDTNQWDGKPFMVSLEFKIYIAWGLLSTILFPLARGLSKSPYSEFLNKETILRIRYFHEMNMLLSAGAILMSISIILIGIETFNNKESKFWNDFLIIHFNLGGFLVLVIMILIIYPRYYITGLYGSKALSENSLSRISRVTINDNSYDEGENIYGKNAFGTMRNRTSSYRNSSINSYGNSLRNSYREESSSRSSYRRNSYLNVARRNRSSYRGSRDSRDSNSSGDLITKSVSELLKEQKKQIETFRRNLNQKWPTTYNINDYYIDNINEEEIKEKSSGDQISQLPFPRRPSLPTISVSYSLPPQLYTRRPSLPTNLGSYSFPSPPKTRRKIWKFK